jgi:large subunit ribosomal protein L21
MYAVIETGGKQYRVAKGDKIKVELLEAEVGANVALDKVLMIGGDGAAVLGKPFVSGGKVTAKVLTHGKGDKVHIIKFRRRKHYMKRQGHRQLFTQLEITDIVGA